MTREEAIKKLSAMHLGLSQDCKQACEMAIEALKKEKDFDYYKSQCKSYEGTINKLAEAIADNKSDDGLLIIKSVGFLTKEDLEYVCNEIAEQRKLGVVVLRHGWDAVLVPSDVEIKIEEKEGKS